MLPTYKFVLVLFLFSIAFNTAFAQTFVMDEGGYLNDDEIELLEEKLYNYNDSTSTQIAIRTVESLGGKSIEEYANELFNQLGIGQKELNNGLLILVSKEERKIRIEVGKGLEDKISNAIAKVIIDDLLTPNIRHATAFEGLDEVTDYIFRLLNGQYISASELEDQIERKKRIEEIRARETLDVFLEDEVGVLRYGQCQKLNRELEKYAKQSGHYIWVRLDKDNEYSFKDRQLELLEVLSEAYPEASHYSLIYMDNYREVLDVICMDGSLVTKWKELPNTVESIEAMEDSFDRLFNDYFNIDAANGNPFYDAAYFHPGINRGVELLKGVVGGQIGLEDIEPSFWYDNDYTLLRLCLYTIGGILFLLLLGKVFGFGSGNSGGGSGYSGSWRNSRGGGGSNYDNFGSSSGGYSGGGSDFGGGSSDGGGASGDY